MFRKFTIVFCIFSLALVIADTIVRSSENLSEKLAVGIFSFDKNTETIEAKLVGYTFSSHRMRNSPTRMSYFYAVAYVYGSERYFAQVEAFHSVSGDFKDHLPLPTKINILIDADNPQICIYPEKYLSVSFGFIMMQAYLCSFLILVLFSSKELSLREQLLRWKNAAGFEKKFGFIMLRLMLFAPLLITIVNGSNYAAAATADLITNHQLMLVSRLPKDGEISISGVAEYVGGDVFTRFGNENWIVFIDKFPSFNLLDCYAVTDEGEKLSLEYKFNGQQLYVKNISDKKSFKYMILQTESATYYLPLKMTFRDKSF